MTFGEKIYKIRTSKGLTQEELARAVGYKSRSTIAKIESGERSAPQPMIKALAKTLGTTTAYLMDGEENPETVPKYEIDFGKDDYMEKLITFPKDIQTTIMLYVISKLPKDVQQEVKKRILYEEGTNQSVETTPKPKILPRTPGDSEKAIAKNDNEVQYLEAPSPEQEADTEVITGEDGFF